MTDDTTHPHHHASTHKVRPPLLLSSISRMTGRKLTTCSWTGAPDSLARTTAFGERIRLPRRLPRQVRHLPFTTFSTKLTRIQVHGSRCLVPNCGSSAWRSPIVPSLLSATNLPKAIMNLAGWSLSAMCLRRYGIMTTVSVCHLWWTPSANVEGHKFLIIFPAQKPVAPPDVFQ